MVGRCARCVACERLPTTVKLFVGPGETARSTVGGAVNRQYAVGDFDGPWRADAVTVVSGTVVRPPRIRELCVVEGIFLSQVGSPKFLQQ